MLIRYKQEMKCKTSKVFIPHAAGVLLHFKMMLSTQGKNDLRLGVIWEVLLSKQVDLGRLQEGLDGQEEDPFGIQTHFWYSAKSLKPTCPPASAGLDHI